MSYIEVQYPAEKAAFYKLLKEQVALYTGEEAGQTAVLANAAAAPCAAMTANLIVFRLRGPALLLYLCVSAVTGTVAGLLGAELVRRLEPVFAPRFQKRTSNT